MKAEATVPADALAAIRAPFLEAGATLIDPPIIQPLNLLLDLAGEAMRARLFVVQDEGGREACLRPDFTVPVARAHLASGAEAGRYLYEGKAFRVAPKDGGDAHAEEFLQIGLEAYGGACGVAEDAAVAGLAWRAASAGGRTDLAISLGDIGLIGAFLDAIGVSALTRVKIIGALAKPKYLEAILVRSQTAQTVAANPEIDALLNLSREAAIVRLQDQWRQAAIEPIGGRSVADVVDRLFRRRENALTVRLTAQQAGLIRRLLAIKGPPGQALDAISALASGESLDRMIDAWRDRVSAMSDQGVPVGRITLAPGFGRTFGYYSGFLFEITAASLPSDTPIAAGGRYDGLLELLGGKAGAAVGCIVRPARAWTGDDQ